MEKRKLPLGIDSFEKLRREDFYYIDKTMLIRDLLQGWAEVNLFTRPRRFGKTLNMSMLKSFFETGTDPALFDGLAIMQETELCTKYLGQFPVIYISLKDLDGLTYAEAENGLAEVIARETGRHGALRTSTVLSEAEREKAGNMGEGRFGEYGLSSALLTLTDLLQKHYRKKVILLIDEYDVPLDKAYQNGYYREMLNLIRSMFSSSLKTNDNLYFAVLTGCLRISKESIFTGLNNLRVHSVADERFDEYFGFTDNEIRELLGSYDMLPYHQVLKEWYDGYRFGEEHVYCPWDVLNYVYDLQGSAKAQPRTYWLNTSENAQVRRLIELSDNGTAQWEIEDLIAGKPVHKRLNEQLTHEDVGKDIHSLWSLLFMTGYLTMAGMPEEDVYELVIPNREIRQIFTRQILAWFEDSVAVDRENQQVLYTAFEKGDAAQIETYLQAKLMDTISYHDAAESFYHGFMAALLSACSQWSVLSNRESGKGRSDILVMRKDRRVGFVIELKYARSAAQLEEMCGAAMKQIADKQYADPLRRSGVKQMLAYGIAFCEKECRVQVMNLSTDCR